MRNVVVDSREPYSTVRAALRLATSPFRTDPNFIVIGAAKAGTTFLYACLCKHPAIARASKKEIHYFERSHLKPLFLYRACFPLKAGMKGRISGEATPGYLFHPNVPANIAHTLPNVKLIALLRDPAHRAYSHWRHNVRRRVENMSFKEAIECEEERIEADYHQLCTDPDHIALDALRFSYKRRGYYAEQLERYFSLFSREQVLIIRSEDMFLDAQMVLQQCFSFLEVKAYEIGDLTPQSVDKKRNDIPDLSDLQLHFKPHNERLYQLLESGPWWI